jgi:hypothetical protein
MARRLSSSVPEFICDIRFRMSLGAESKRVVDIGLIVSRKWMML